jgi:uncharacterized protein (TIGR03000 family)
MFRRHLPATSVLAVGLAALLAIPAPAPAQQYRGYYYSNGYWWAYNTYRHGYNPGYYARPYPVSPHGVAPGHYGGYSSPAPAPGSGKGTVKSGAVYTYPWPGPVASSPPAGLTAGAAAPAPTGPSPVEIEVWVPADAAIWFDGARTTQTGTVRQFVSPPVTPGHDYTYVVRATWQENGREVTQSRRITVHAGDQVSIAFPEAVPPKSK